MDVRIGEDGGEIVDRDVGGVETVDHRIDAGHRPEDQHEDRIEDEEGEDGEQQTRPQESDDVGPRRMPGTPAGGRYRRGRSLHYRPPQAAHNVRADVTINAADGGRLGLN